MIVYNSGDKDGDDLLQLNEKHKGERSMSKIHDLMQEIEVYKQAIQDAKDALESAEMELDATLAEEFCGQE